ncbi:hypothetical protein B5G20_02460 [Collinsella sp. An7]|uniref:PHP domain-containing protein n=1 Tax=Collinsella sp. An7 TaxID=1965651 RepID=UPI000B38BCD8|nr:PHP domain-containing protein [Collinsella sp. An7]OUN47603.1 hypothetical protein B5G20_02460 [Collinsella sp. An7]
MSLPACARIDCHTHTSFSDGVSTFAENVRAAAACGCRVLVSTDHLTLPASMDPACEVSVAEDELAAHRAAWEEARALAAEIAPELELVYGFECDWYEGCEANVARWSAGAVVRLGSVHWIGDPGDVTTVAAHPEAVDDPALRVARAGMPGSDAGWIDDGDDLHLWHELGPDELWRRYVATWCRACESPLDFDVMAHPDLAMRFAAEGLAPTIDLAPLWGEMVACAHDTGRRIELSTAGLRKGVGDYYPAAGLLARFARAEVPLVFSSDAHVARDICWGITDAQRHAWEAGYRSFEAPHADGSWETVAL